MMNTVFQDKGGCSNAQSKVGWNYFMWDAYFNLATHVKRIKRINYRIHIKDKGWFHKLAGASIIVRTRSNYSNKSWPNKNNVAYLG